MLSVLSEAAQLDLASLECGLLELLDAETLDIRGRRFEPSLAPENDIVRHRIVVRQEPQNKFTGLDPRASAQTR